MKVKKERKIRNRASTSDRPVKKEQLRVYEPSKDDVCHNTKMGHDYRFLPFDSYGCCARCGTEILT